MAYVTNIKSHVPFLLDINDGNYNAWRELLSLIAKDLTFLDSWMARCYQPVQTTMLGRNTMD